MPIFTTSPGNAGSNICSMPNSIQASHPLQNRVDPFGQLISTTARGAWMGNRGLIHNAAQQIVRPYKLKAWIICQLKFGDRHRVVMTPNLYTELFFLDEATAFSTGHRPCAECRRQDYNRFKQAWVNGNPSFGFGPKTPVAKTMKSTSNESMTGVRNRGII